MERTTDGDDAAAAEPPAGATAAILSAAVAQAVARTDAKLAFDMLLLHEQLQLKEADRGAATAENAALRQALAELKQQQSAMHVYLHTQLDAQVARVEALERALAASEASRAALEADAAAALETAAAAHLKQLEEAEERATRLADQLREVHAFMEQKRELERELASLTARLETQQAAFSEREAALERKFLVETGRGQRELLARAQATKQALAARAAGQLHAATRRTMMENEHFVDELAFQSRESEALAKRAAQLDAGLRALKAENAVLEANEAALARKALYYRRMLRSMRSKAVASESLASEALADRRRHAADESDGSDGSEDIDVAGDELRGRVEELESKLQRAMDWLRVVEADKQLLLARQDEVLQFLLAALDEGGRRLSSDASSPEDPRVALAGETSSLDALVALFPRPLAIDELDTRALLRFLLDKLRVYQQQVAAVFHQQQQQQRPSAKDKPRGLELPPIGAAKSPGKPKALAASPLKRRAFFAHVSAAVAREEAAAPGVLSPELLAVATGQFNFVSTGSKSRSGGVAAARSPSPERRAPSAKLSVKRVNAAVLAPSGSTMELLTPWPSVEMEMEEPEQ